jgi:hypothetical protein
MLVATIKERLADAARAALPASCRVPYKADAEIAAKHTANKVPHSANQRMD